MTNLALVPSNCPPPKKAAPAKYTPAETAAIEAYQGALAAGRYYKLFNSGSPFARLISGDDSEVLPLSFLSSDFADFCKDTGRRPPKKPPTDLYLSYSLETVTGTKFVPNGPNLIRAKYSRHRYVNTYKRFEPKHAAIELSGLFLGHLRSMFPVPEELHTFCQYIGHAINFPQDRTSWHLMLPSEQGVGKGFTYNDIISPLFSMQTKLVARIAALTGQFGATTFEQSIFVLIDDCKAGSESTQTQMKSVMSEERIYIEHKGKQGGMTDIYTRIILASNEDVPMPVEEQTRRWWIPQKLGFCNGLTGKAGQHHRQARIKELSKWLKLPGAIEAVYEYFNGYPLENCAPLPDFDPKNVPITASFERMVAKSETPEQSFTADFLEQHPTKILKLEDVQAEFVRAKMGKPTNAAAADQLTFCKYQKDTLTANGLRGRWWFPLAMTKAEAEAILEAEPAF
jgi:hypothetical protein